MTAPPAASSLVDRAALALRRARAGRDPDALFLHREARDALLERLAEVNRRFTAPAIVTGHPGVFADMIPDARVVPDAPVLDLEPGAHDLVVHAMALHWADDPVGQLIQCRRALVPDGLLLAASFGGASLWELREALARAEAEVTGGLSPRVAPMAEIRDLGGLMQRAGLALPVADRDRRRVLYRSAWDLMRDLRGMGEANALAARHKRTPPRALFARAAALYADAHGERHADGVRVPATIEVIHLSGWAPAENQPRPLRPGSATARLADALGTAETPLPRGE